MIINWFGQSCYKIQGENSVLIIDPSDDSSGVKISKFSADIITTSSGWIDDKLIKKISGPKPFVIKGPGEYEFKNIFIYGIDAVKKDKDNENKERNIIYRIEIDGVKLAHLGNLKETIANGQLEKIEGVDILMIPVGGGNVINSKQATELISQLEPRIVVPMCYDIPGIKSKHKMDGVENFCREIGVCPKERINKFKISKKDLPQQDLQVVILEP